MKTTSYAELPLFERFNTVAGNDELFDEVVSSGFAELPADDVFMVAHRMLRDTPYGPRPYHELTYVMEGHALARIGKQEVHLLPDSLLLAPPSCHHGLVATDQEAIVVVLCLRPALFSSGVFQDFLAQDNPVARTMRSEGQGNYLVLSDTYGRILYRSVRTLLKEYAHAGHTASFSVKARSLLLLAQLSEIDTYSFYGLDQQMMEIVAYLREHCETASVASVAQRFGYSETYFSQLVHRRCGVRARELIVAARLRKARELLLSTDLAARDVAAAVGYTSYSHFNRIFRQVYHITPAAYRSFAARELAQ
ncbi:MAG: helix-turn-helix domain-containing protein [Atopobiaceae bacterium]|nr:helix-turn-helix domain-containing protein [Atopobiaceae bacterium]